MASQRSQLIIGADSKKVTCCSAQSHILTTRIRAGLRSAKRSRKFQDDTCTNLLFMRSTCHANASSIAHRSPHNPPILILMWSFTSRTESPETTRRCQGSELEINPAILHRPYRRLALTLHIQTTTGCRGPHRYRDMYPDDPRLQAPSVRLADPSTLRPTQEPAR